MSNTPQTDVALLALAVVLMLAGAALLVAEAASAGIAIPLVAIGIAFVAIVQTGRRGQHTRPR